jgi:hypothetical protein
MISIISIGPIITYPNVQSSIFQAFFRIWNISDKSVVPNFLFSFILELHGGQRTPLLTWNKIYSLNSRHMI